MSNPDLPGPDDLDARLRALGERVGSVDLPLSSSNLVRRAETRRRRRRTALAVPPLVGGLCALGFVLSNHHAPQQSAGGPTAAQAPASHIGARSPQSGSSTHGSPDVTAPANGLNGGEKTVPMPVQRPMLGYSACSVRGNLKAGKCASTTSTPSAAEVTSAQVWTGSYGPVHTLDKTTATHVYRAYVTAAPARSCTPTGIQTAVVVYSSVGTVSFLVTSGPCSVIRTWRAHGLDQRSATQVLVSLNKAGI